jgi:hypothetical protein
VERETGSPPRVATVAGRNDGLECGQRTAGVLGAQS